MPQGSRRQSRTYALQVLYAADVAAHEDLGQAARTTWDTFEPELDASSESIAFAETLLGYVSSDRDIIDDIIAGASRNWRLERMSRVDRNILRLAVAEMRSGGVPHKVIINEAVELAKRFGTEDSAAFINGILDRVAHDLGERTT